MKFYSYNYVLGQISQQKLTSDHWDIWLSAHSSDWFFAAKAYQNTR